MRFQSVSRVWAKVLPWLQAVTACFFLGIALAPAAIAQNFVVNSTADRVDDAPGDMSCDTGQKVGGAPECTLRAAVDEVNALSQQNPGTAYTVSLPAGTYFITTMEVCPYHDAGNPNLLSRTATTVCISGNLTLSGADPATTIIDGGNLDRMFFVSVGAKVSINNVTIQNGTMAVPGSFDGSGGGINNQGTLALSNDVFTHNSDNNPSHLGGGAIFNAGTLTVEGCSFIANADTAITANYATNTSINLSYFAQNTGYQGAAVSTFIGPLQISNSSFVNNTVEENGIIFAYNGVATITNSTISNNIVQNSGTLVSGGNGSSMILDNDTIYGNIARTGEAKSQAGLVADNASIANTILAGNSATDCTVVSLINYGHNIIQHADFDSLCRGGQNSTTLTGVDPQLGPLSTNGQILITRAPLPGSPAIGAGSDVTPGSNAVSACTALDQRGFVRGVSGACTIGAVEVDHGSQSPSILPASHGASGTTTAVIYGGNFNSSSTVSFQLGGKPSLTPVSTVVDASTKALAVTLNLNGASTGLYDVVVNTPGRASLKLPAAYRVETPGASNLYSYAVGPEAARAGRPAFYSIVYGNRGNVDAFLVPLSLSLSGSYASLITSPVLTPPAKSGQVLHDFTYVPIEVSPYSTSGDTNVPLLVPVIPAGSQGVLTFSLTPPSGLHGASNYTFMANLGDPDSMASDGSPTAAAVSNLVSGAQSYAQTNLGVKLSQANLADVTTYATAQLQQVVSLGKQSLLESAQGESIFFSTPQLAIDTAFYGASLAAGGNTAASTRPALRGLSFGVTPQDSTPSSGTTLVPCHKGQVMEPGTSCDANASPAPTPQPPRKDFKITRYECEALGDHYVTDDGFACMPRDPKGCAALANPIGGNEPRCARYRVANSIDPNEKDGPRGVGVDHFVQATDSSTYQIEFENEAAANAAAQTVTVTDQLDASKLDLSTFQLGPISFGKYRLTPPPGLKAYAFALDLRPDAKVIVSIKAGIDSSTGIAKWSFSSLDPATMKLTADPLAGFLPPDVTPPAGIGHVEFSVKPLGSLTSGAKICNSATIVFDTNAPIATAPFCNSKDTVAPSSHVMTLAAVTSTATFAVSWTGTDAGSGIASYDVFVSDNGGPFASLIADTDSTSIQFNGRTGHTYSFYSLATDAVGNVEAAKKTADAITAVNITPTVAVPNVIGLAQSSAASAIAAANLRLGTVTMQSSATIAAGLVISESPAAGSSVAAKSAVNLVVSSGPALVKVPNVVGSTQTAASTALSSAGLVLGSVTSTSSATVAMGLVISESPPAGATVALKSAVSVVTSSGPLVGDVNGDGAVNCADLAIVKASFGKRTGQAGFDARADVNHDGMVNIVDLSTVSRAIPSGTTCN